MNFLKTFLATLLAIFTTCILLIFILVGIIGAASSSSSKDVIVKEQSVLEINFETPILDDVNPMAELLSIVNNSSKSIKLRNLIDAIERAKDDENIEGISLKLSGFATNLSNSSEIKTALKSFKESGKFIYAYADNFGKGNYYMASSADSIFMHPVGFFEFNGLGGQMMFYKKALAKLGVKPQVVRAGKFKSAVEPFIKEKMSPENKLQMEELVGGLWANMLQEISDQRNISTKKLNYIADKMTVTDAQSALEARMIDAEMYIDQYNDLLKSKSAVEKLNIISVQNYIKSNFANSLSDSKEKDKIAILYAQGEITMGGDESEKITPKFAEKIKKAKEDEEIKAIVIRVNSPGGSAHASDIIWREVELAKKVKPVVVSFGRVAASGGYYISCGANKIVAESNTITGSIGVFGLFFQGEELLKKKLGLSFDSFKTNEHSDFLGGTGLPVQSRSMNDFEKKIMEKMIDKVYIRFKSLVAEGRNKTLEEIEQIAQGRVWLGTTAKEIGLVDEIGGLNKAIEIAAQEAKLENFKAVEMVDADDFMSVFKFALSQAKVYLTHELVGEKVKYINKVEEQLSNSGIQTRMPFEIEIR